MEYIKSMTMNDKPSRFQRAKAWVKKHQEAIAYAGVGTVVLGMFYVVVKADIADRERSNAELNTRIDELNAWQREENNTQGYIDELYMLANDVNMHIDEVYNRVNGLDERVNGLGQTD